MKTLAKSVPKYIENFTSPKRYDYCVIIPVINEGERIKNLLNRMKAMNVHTYSDIIIVDGGSTDGSLEETALRDLQVHSLITKKDIGKLSSQLRCAYDYALKSGYTGIVTIDGNDKDDPEAIPAFIHKLQEGYDFIQASRFLPGGYEENTPFIRNVAVRFIHAPVLSVASGFHWTDTTQGFRGYSAKMLKHLNIFREDFQKYELIAYLSYVAPRKRFRCIELPTRRVYPTGEVPTKISSIRGNYDLLKTLYQVCTGHYDR